MGEAVSIQYPDFEYLWSFKRKESSTLQQHLPPLLVQLKEKYAAWAQSIYIAGILPYTDSVEHDVAILKPGLPYLANNLHKAGIKVLSIDDQPEIRHSLESKIKFSGKILDTHSLADLNIPDQSVAVTVSHNILQNAQTLDDAINIVRESLRITNNVVYHQVTDRDNFFWGMDDQHRLKLSVDDWLERVIQPAIESVGSDWRVREVHYVKPFDINIGRQPVIIMERELTQRKITLPKNISTLTKLQAEMTGANAVSLMNPSIALAGSIAFIDKPELLPLAIAGSYILDALDGALARRSKNRQNFSGKNHGAWIDVIADRMTETTYSLALEYKGLISPLIPVFFVGKGIIVDSFRIMRSHRKKKSYESPLSGNNEKRVQRAVYGVSKAVYFASAATSKINPYISAIKDLAEIVTLTIGSYRSSRSLYDSVKNITKRKL